MQKASLKILALAGIMSAALSSGAQAQSTTTGLDTAIINNVAQPQVFGVGGHQVGSWTQSLFTISTPATITGQFVVNGAAQANSLMINNGGSVSAAAYYHSSDARLKTDIHPISGALDKVLALHGVEFNWKKDGRADMGVVAQNVAQVFPNVVTKNDQGVMAVEYDSLVGPMIEAIRDLKAQNDDLRAQVKEIRISMQTLKQENTRLHSVKADSDVVQQPATLNP